MNTVLELGTFKSVNFNNNEVTDLEITLTNVNGSDMLVFWEGSKYLGFTLDADLTNLRNTRSDYSHDTWQRALCENLIRDMVFNECSNILDLYTKRNGYWKHEYKLNYLLESIVTSWVNSTNTLYKLLHRDKYNFTDLFSSYIDTEYYSGMYQQLMSHNNYDNIDDILFKDIEFCGHETPSNVSVQQINNAIRYSNAIFVNKITIHQDVHVSELESILEIGKYYSNRNYYALEFLVKVMKNSNVHFAGELRYNTVT